MTDGSSPQKNAFKRTALYDYHAALGAKFVPVYGYEMPIQYPNGVLQEHNHTRNAAGIFDVSHMGQICVRRQSGNISAAALALETLVPADIVGLGVGRQRYTTFLNSDGAMILWSQGSASGGISEVKGGAVAAL